MKVKVYYTTVLTQEIEIDDKFSILTNDFCENLSDEEVNLEQELWEIGCKIVEKNNGWQLNAIETLDGESLAEW